MSYLIVALLVLFDIISLRGMLVLWVVIWVWEQALGD